MSADVLERAFASTAKVLANLGSDQLDQPTPCASWTVRDLVNHIVGAASWYAITAETGAAPTGEHDELAADFTTGDVQSAFEQGAQRAVAAFRAPGAMDKTMTLPFGEMPGSAFVLLASTDTFTHAWDLAKAIGQPSDLDPELAEQLLEFSKVAVPEEARGPEGRAVFGPVVEPPPDASAADRLAAYLGRQP